MPTQKQKDERIRITLPRDPLNPDEKVERVIINGTCTTIKRGEEVEVPREVYEVLKQGKRI